MVIKNIVRRYAGVILLGLVLLYTAYLHGSNMFAFPYYESDEGTYTSQAWSVMTEGTLSPYTYWYDHPPLGWLSIAAWYSILPEHHLTFGNSIDTGRVLMLIIFLINTSLVFYLTRGITRSNMLATLACILFASSPLILYFSRRVLLDNIQILWLLLSVAVLMAPQLTLRRYLWSGAFFGFAFLTKITAVMFGFPLLFLVIALKDKTHKLFRTFAWLCASGLMASIYFLYAALKSELVPPLFSNEERVSFWTTLQFQMSRGAESIPFYLSGSDFMNAVQVWMQRDSFLVLLTLGVLVVGVLTFYFIKNTWYRFFVLANLFFILFLIRGGLVIDFYFMPMTPFLVILFTLVVWQFSLVFKKVTKIPKISTVLSLVAKVIPLTCITVLLFYYNVIAEQRYLTVDETTNQRLATEWIKRTLPENADILIDSVMYVELRDPNYVNSKVFSNSEWFYKVSRDPAIRDDKYHGEWQRFDYIALTHEMLKQIDNFPDEDMVTQAFDNALPLKKWFENSTSFIDEQKRISTNGDWAMVYDVNSETGVQLEHAWDYYKENFIVSYGQVIDPMQDSTTSEGQSYAMLRAAWMNDHDTFKGVWLWTQHHLQHRLEDKLISWKWQNGVLADPANATDADIDIALALLFGYKTFGVEQYLTDAQTIINDLWEQSVTEIDGTYYLVSSNISHGQVPTGILFNPSYLSPAHFRLFAEVDTNPDHDWVGLADDTYVIINDLRRQYQTPFIKNWYVVNQETGAYLDASPYIGASANYFSYDSFRIFWRLWLDYAWYNNKSAENYLGLVGNYIDRNFLGNSVPTIFDPVTGEVISYQPSLAILSSYIFPLTFATDSSAALEHYTTVLADQYNEEGYWAYPEIYYDQNWAWFHAALFNNDVYNIWTFYDQ